MNSIKWLKSDYCDISTLTEYARSRPRHNEMCNRPEYTIFSLACPQFEWPHFSYVNVVSQYDINASTTTIVYLSCLKGHCIEFKYYADGIHSGLTPPGNNS